MDPSTIACTLYNMLALGACSLEEAGQRAARLGHQHTIEELQSAAESLLELGRIAVVDAVEGIYRVSGPANMVVTKRDRDDAWHGWELKSVPAEVALQVIGAAAPIMLDDVIGGG